MSKFYMISFNFQSVPIEADDIKEKLSIMKDWASFSPTSWLVYTSLNADAVYMRLEPLRTHKQFCLVTQIETSNWFGWASEETLQWLLKERPAEMPGI